MIVYHYTTKEAFDEIMKTKQFLPSSPWTTMDSAYGTGWYFTDLDPNTCDIAVAYYCWRDTSQEALKRVEYYLKFDIDSQILKNSRGHVFMVQKWDKDLIKYLSGNRNKDCPLKPCETCEKGKKYKK